MAMSTCEGAMWRYIVLLRPTRQQTMPLAMMTIKNEMKVFPISCADGAPHSSPFWPRELRYEQQTS